MNDRNVSIGIVGCGYWGPNLVRNFSSLPDCRVGAVCDRDQARLDHMTQVYPGVKGCREIDEIVRDPGIDAVAIATPVKTHHGIARALLDAGKHVFLEKPMAASVAECKDLVARAAAKKLRLMVGHTFVYTSAVRKIKELVESGEIGELQYISSRRLNLGLLQKDINVAWDLAPHDISIILYVTGKSPVAVNCQGSAHVRLGIEDVTVMTLHFGNGLMGVVKSSWIDPRKVRETTIVGSKKMIVYDDNEPLEKLRIYDKRVEIPPHYDTYAEFTYSYHYGDMLAPYLKQYEPLRTECQAFLDGIREGKPSDSDGPEGLRVVEILEAASRSLAADGNRVQING